MVYSASHIDAIPDTLVSSVATSSAQLTQSTTSTAAPISIPTVVDQSGMGVAGGGATGAGTGGAPGETVIPNSILGQSEVVTQIQGAMADLHGQLMSGAPTTMEGGTANSGGGNPGIQESIMTQGGVVGGDSIQDSIQDTIVGGAASGTATAAAILGQVAGSSVGKTAGIQDSSQFLNPAATAAAAAAGNMMSGGGGGGGGEGSSSGGGEGPTSVSDIASQLISQYVASTQSVAAPFQPPASNTGTEQGQVESMQTDVSAETTLPPSVST